MGKNLDSSRKDFAPRPFGIRLSCAGAVAPHAPTHESGGGDEINVTGLFGELADGQKWKEYAGFFTQAIQPTVLQIPDGKWGGWFDTVSNKLWWIRNRGDVLYGVELHPMP